MDLKGSSDFKKISDFCDAWNSLYNQNEAAINNSEYIIFELVAAGTDFISGVQYDLLNMENKNGRFEGDLMMAGFPGFLERSESKMSFGYDYIREEDGFAPTMKAGDRIVEEGSCDLGKETYQTETFTERNGEKIERIYSEYKRIKGGEMICLRTTGHSINAREEAELSNTCTYIKAGKDQYDFVIGKAAQGPTFEKLSFIDKDDLTKDEARQMLEAAGYQIEQSGGIANGTLFVD
ncbi:MAG: hypothetical protein PHT78_02625 [Desulfitobacteriaceae bacterium]|nr:hypothetical protein [Desulfitobacteriaceae bacterium]MDD4752134.1 hypothetical protein [Desulfitobacteriaceae bacterium]